ncbi:MAG: aspartate aminotransferase family protein [Alphaproteobacteria bacterium]|nr:aspartate aminotransferase family protein [Alphaproteobacteria bacterium]
MTALMPTYARSAIAFERGDGAYLTATDGRTYLDFAAGIAVDCLGHAHPHLVSALSQQAGKLWHVSNLYEIPEQARYAERLTDACFADAVFFCNSGAEAMEGAIKAARRYHAHAGAPERYRAITISGAFHGRTLATLAAAANPKHLEGYGPPVDGFDQVAFANMNELRAAIGSETAAIIAEPVQGEGGIRVMDDDYLRGLRDTADEFGLLLIFDEVQSGFGRTGKLFAHEHSGISPDIVAAAKGIAGGFPCGAVLAVDKVAAAMTPGSHGSTFGGNPLAMAVANATLDVILGQGFLSDVEKAGRDLRASLDALAAKYPRIVTEIRGIGLMIGMHIDEAVTHTDFCADLMENGLLTVPAAENVVRLLPPLIVREKEIAEALTILERTCDSIILPTTKM